MNQVKICRPPVFEIEGRMDGDCPMISRSAAAGGPGPGGGPTGRLRPVSVTAMVVRSTGRSVPSGVGSRRCPTKVGIAARSHGLPVSSRAQRCLVRNQAWKTKRSRFLRSDSSTNPDLLVSVQSVESASRTALALDTRASLLHAVEMPAMDTAMDGAPVVDHLLLLFSLDLSI